MKMLQIIMNTLMHIYRELKILQVKWILIIFQILIIIYDLA